MYGSTKSGYVHPDRFTIVVIILVFQLFQIMQRAFCPLIFSITKDTVSAVTS